METIRTIHAPEGFACSPLREFGWVVWSSATCPSDSAVSPRATTCPGQEPPQLRLGNSYRSDRLRNRGPTDTNSLLLLELVCP